MDCTYGDYVRFLGFEAGHSKHLNFQKAKTMISLGYLNIDKTIYFKKTTKKNVLKGTMVGLNLA